MQKSRTNTRIRNFNRDFVYFQLPLNGWIIFILFFGLSAIISWIMNTVFAFFCTTNHMIHNVKRKKSFIISLSYLRDWNRTPNLPPFVISNGGNASIFYLPTLICWLIRTEKPLYSTRHSVYANDERTNSWKKKS